jgi:ATP-dependent RNA helicase DHX29
VHERQALGDFLLIVLRELLGKRPDLRLVLMSATVNQELFCRYMGGCPAFSIPGRCYPVQEQYLEDVLEATRHFIEEGSPFCRRDMRAQFKSTTVEVSGRAGNSYAQRLEWQEEATEMEGRRGPGWAGFMDQCREEGYGAMTLKSLGRVDETVLNPDLIEDLLKHIVEAEPEHVKNGDPGWREDGAILVFLPGLGEIRGLLERLQGGRLFRDERRFWLLPLHSALSSAEQQRVFQRPPHAGVRKIILSTNIAEASLTIDDVGYVIDCGLVREVQLAGRGRGGGRALVTTWCCRASAKQRMGRAGRVAPGVCFRLFSRYTHDAVMDEFAVPELQRTPLEELCLQVRANGLAPSCRAFLGQAPEPPDPVAVDAAVRVLHEVGALARREGADGGGGKEEEGELTPLGVHLAKLPVDVRIGKVRALPGLI